MIEIFYVLDGVVEFAFDDENVTATAGTTLNVPPDVRHEVKSPDGAKLLTIFTVRPVKPTNEAQSDVWYK